MVIVKTIPLTIATCDICGFEYRSENKCNALRKAKKCEALGAPEHVPFGTIFERTPISGDDRIVSWRIVVPRNLRPSGYAFEDEGPLPNKVLADEKEGRHIEQLVFAEMNGSSPFVHYSERMGYLGKNGNELRKSCSTKERWRKMGNEEIEALIRENPELLRLYFDMFYPAFSEKLVDYGLL